MLSLILAALAMVLPLPVLDARIQAYHTHLETANLTVADRYVVASMLSDAMVARYRILEGFD